MFTQLQQIVRNHQHSFFITHTTLPGPMSQGNAIADSLVGGAHVTETMHFHFLTHTNAGGLCSPFPITNKQARQIVQTCRFLMLHRNTLKE